MEKVVMLAVIVVTLGQSLNAQEEVRR